jgi:cytochrome b subunit of formate dehydrogenase
LTPTLIELVKCRAFPCTMFGRFGPDRLFGTHTVGVSYAGGSFISSHLHERASRDNRRKGIPLPFLGLLLVFIFHLAAIPSILGAPQDIPCSLCHDDVSLVSSVHEIFDCASCHSNIEEMPHQESSLAQLSGVDLCSQCHADAASELEDSVHDQVVDCQSCHGKSHEVLPLADLASPMSPLKQIQVCNSCHDAEELIDGYLGSVHGRALVVSGLVNAPSCSDCHGSHSILPPSDEGSAVSHQKLPSTCGSCHQYIVATWEKESAHGQAWTRNLEGPICSTCHSSHRVMEPRAAGQRLKFPSQCGDCHGGSYVTYRDSFHGQVTDLGYQTAAICSDCHTPHANLPADDPRSTVHVSNLKNTCGKCHQDTNGAFLTFDPHNDPSDPTDSRKIFTVWLFMTTLLVLVFGGFGVHDLLWFQRSLVAYFRGELDSVRSNNGTYIKRFTSANVWLHGIIVVSFLLLALTGLPLKFHFTDWAKDLAGLLGGVGFARFLHRFAALVTFGYALYHLGYLFRRIFMKKDLGLLWGWRSMVPRGQDFVDLWRNIRYFLYLGPRPPLDRWAYWEKFDYFAVFWGIIIIGISGLFLWFPGFFTLFFPGWSLNAAFVIHSDEALLAVGFIFLFHFFHTHLRPESFPLDPVIFTGRVPLERFKEERPVEYQRLVSSGKLEASLVSPPSPAQLRFARIFGFSAVVLGVVLMLAMLWGFLAY